MEKLYIIFYSTFYGIRRVGPLSKEGTIQNIKLQKLEPLKDGSSQVEWALRTLEKLEVYQDMALYLSQTPAPYKTLLVMRVE